MTTVAPEAATTGRLETNKGSIFRANSDLAVQPNKPRQCPPILKPQICQSNIRGCLTLRRRFEGYIQGLA
jgi:hypothetical protein